MSKEKTAHEIYFNKFLENNDGSPDEQTLNSTLSEKGKVLNYSRINHTFPKSFLF